MVFFIPFTCITLFQFYFHLPCMESEKKIFLYIWLVHPMTLHQRRQKIASLDTIAFLESHVRINSILTKQWNYNISVEIIHSYLRYADRLLDVFFLLLAVILSVLHEKPKTERLSNRKKYIEQRLLKLNMYAFYHIFRIFTRVLITS